MDQERYDIYFTGKIAEGVPTEVAQQNLASLFKTSVDKVSRLFNGKPQLLKRGMDKTTTIKYKAAFEGAGLVIAFKKISPAQTEAVQPQKSEGSMTLAAAGSNVLREDERKVIPEADIDTSNIKLVSAFMEPEVAEKQAVAAPDTSHISVAEVGADILAEKPDAPAPPELQLDELSLAPAGSPLEQLHEDLPELNPDISGITLAEVGADVLADKKEPVVPPPPNIDHLTIKKES